MGSILQPHILLKYFVQSGKKQSVTGLRAVKPGSGGRGHVTTLQISEHISARQGGGCKNTQLLLGDILPPPFAGADCGGLEEQVDSPRTK